MSPSVALHLAITGHVQGVGYRWSLVREAGRLGMRGWVRNRHDGSVEALVEGPQPSVDRLVAWARRGPAGAVVTGVDVRPAALDEAAELAALAGFEQRPTA
jgi:acylphosphatase